MKNDQMYLHPEVETLSRPDIEKLQLKRLKATIDRCMHSPFYKERFQQCGIKPEDIQSLEDLQKIPFTTKQDLRDHYPFGLLPCLWKRWSVSILPVVPQELLP
mgnify:CR=1 FL=1